MLIKLLSVFVILISSTAYAVDLDRTQLRKDLQGINPIPSLNNNIKGIWFSSADADKILQILEVKLPQALDIIDAQSAQVENNNKAIDLYKTSNNQYKDLADYNRKMYDTAMKYFPDIKPPETPWYKSRTVLFVEGVVTGVAVILVSVLVLDHLPVTK
jgi:hypothetical protein